MTASIQCIGCQGTYLQKDFSELVVLGNTRPICRNCVSTAVAAFAAKRTVHTCGRMAAPITPLLTA